MRRIDQRVTLHVEDNTGHKQYRGLGGNQPGVAGAATHRVIFVAPTGYGIGIK